MKTQSSGLSTAISSGVRRSKVHAQQGVVLFIALIALLAMSLAALALIRSVDTGGIIAGNLAFRQSATTLSDVGIEAAIIALECRGKGIIYPAPCSATDPVDARDPQVDRDHPFNVTDKLDPKGYYSNVGTINLTDSGTWVDKKSVEVNKENGYMVRYVIERMCRPLDIAAPVDQLLSDKQCLLSDADTDTSGKQVLSAPEAGGKKPSNPPMYRITIRTTGPKNTVSYVQAFAY